MVSLNTILVLGALIVGFILITGAGGPAGLGRKIGAGIGGGLSQFSTQLGSAFTGALFGGAVNPDVGVQNIPQNIARMADPLGFQRGIFGGLLDAIGNLTLPSFPSPFAFGETITPRQARTTSFAISQLRAGQTVQDITVKPTQGTAVSRTGQRFVSNLGGRERAFGSQESLNSFVERFNR